MLHPKPEESLWLPQQQQQIVVKQEPVRPLRRVAAALTEVGDSLIGVVK